MKTILLISPYWKEPHRWMVSSVKLATLWQQLGYSVVVACMGKETSVEKISDTLTIYHRKDWFIPDPWNTGIAFGFAGYVSRLHDEIKPDVVVINKILFWSSLSLFRLRLKGIHPVVLTDALVGITWWPRGALPKVVARIAAWTVGHAILRLARRVVFFHPQPEHVLRWLGVNGKHEVIPTGIDLSAFPQRNAELKMQNDVSVTYVGRLESVKGVDDFVAAVVPLKKEFPNLSVRVVGWYAEGHPLVAQYKDAVQFEGLRQDIPLVLSETDIFVLPSYSEGLSNALMEAMASGCACVATEVGGNRFLLENGVSGFLFPPGDREALKAHVRRLLEDPAKRKSLSEAARQRIEHMFSWKVVGDQYRQLFSRLGA